MSRIAAVRILPDVETERLSLHRWTSGDAAGLADLNADAAVVEFLNDGVPYSRGESRLVSERIAEHWRDYGFGLWSARRSDGDRQLLGFIGVCHPLWFPEWAQAVEVGWRLRRDAWGQGYATEGARAALAAAFAAIPLREIVAFVHPDNARSHAVTRRLGMAYDRRVPHPTRPHDVDIYVIGRPGLGAMRG